MALDRFVLWGERRPTRDEVAQIVTDFLGGVGDVKWDDVRCVVSLPGKNTHPLRSVDPRLGGSERDEGERWIEVYYGEDNVDVITRLADSFTNGLAARLALTLAHYYGAGYDDGVVSWEPGEKALL